jgi:hypothetical protein
MMASPVNLQQDRGVTSIKDFLFARYALKGADVRLWNETRVEIPPTRERS